MCPTVYLMHYWSSVTGEIQPTIEWSAVLVCRLLHSLASAGLNLKGTASPAKKLLIHTQRCLLWIKTPNIPSVASYCLKLVLKPQPLFTSQWCANQLPSWSSVCLVFILDELHGVEIKQLKPILESFIGKKKKLRGTGCLLNALSWCKT